MKIVFVKVTAGRGRPSKFVELDDGTRVPYKDYAKDHPESFKQISATSSSSESSVSAEFPVPSTIKSSKEVTTAVKEVPVKVYAAKNALKTIAGTTPTRTIFGTPINITGVCCDGFLNVIVGDAGSYVIPVAIEDIVKPNPCPPEMESLKFAIAVGNFGNSGNSQIPSTDTPVAPIQE